MMRDMITVVCCLWMSAVLGCGGKASSPEPTEPQAQNTEQVPSKEPANQAANEPTAQGEPTSSKEENPIVDVSRLDPNKATAKAPLKYTVKLETTKGDVLIDVTRAWAPLGADRFYNLVTQGYFDNIAFFRVIGGFMAQTGLHGDPGVNRVWREARIEDDPVKQTNTRGMVSFATAGPGTRTTQFFINFSNNTRLDAMGFSPFGKVRDMKPVDALYAEYGEGAPGGNGPNQARIQLEGNTYLKKEFPQLDYIKHASIVK